MENQESHLDQIREIRQIMEKSTKFISLSGISGVWVGAIALLGISAAFWQFSDYFINRYSHGGVFTIGELLQCDDLRFFIQFILIDAFVMLVLAIGGAVFFSIRKAGKKGQSVWDRSAKRFLVSLMVPLVAGGLFTLAIVLRGMVELAGPATLIFYGIALFNAGRYTLDDIRYLGILEIFLGLLAIVFIGYTAVFWAIGFGILHIIYGLVMYYKYER